MTSTRRRSSLSQFLGSIVSKSLSNVSTDVDLSPLETDLLVSYQLSLDTPSELGKHAFHEAKVVNSKDMSARVHEALIKHDVLRTDASLPTDRVMVDTSKITRNFANQLPFCSGFMLKRIVSLLFIFEEQAMRWHVLDQEEADLRDVLAQAPESMKAELQLRLQAVAKKRALLPSQQMNASRRTDSDLPEYSLV